ncbi:MAG TPA: ATP-dependent helicase, partial [Methylocella sp.]
ARLHEEIILVTAAWTEAGRGTKPLRPFGTIREEATLEQLDKAFANPREPALQIIERIRQWAAQDAADLERELRRRAEAQKAEAIKDLTALGEAEAKSLQRLLEDQRTRIAKADAAPEDTQLSLFPDAEAEQYRRDRRRWKAKLEKLTIDIAQEPERVRQSYSVVADRLETIGLVYLWPESN